MEKYNIPFAVRPVARFVDDFSTWYIRRSRDRFKVDDEKDIMSALDTTAFVLLQLSKLMAPFMPFIAEQIWQRVTGFNFEEADRSVHLERWPSQGKINKEVLKQMKLARQIVEEGLSKRAESGIKVRQPLLSYSTDIVENLPEEYQKIITDELNVKKLLFGENKLETKMTEELIVEGVKREVVRTLNAMRKNLNLTVQDKVAVKWQLTEEEENSPLRKVFETLTEEVSKDVQAKKIEEGETEESDLQKELKVNKEKIILGVKKK